MSAAFSASTIERPISAAMATLTPSAVAIRYGTNSSTATPFTGPGMRITGRAIKAPCLKPVCHVK